MSAIHRPPPDRDRDRDLAVAHRTAVAGLVGVFAYQGLVPKVWRVDTDEVAIWQGLGLDRSRARKVVRTVGAVEAGFAVAVAARSAKRWPFAISMAAMPTLVIGAARSDRSILTKAFNPGSLGIAVVALAGVALATRQNRPPRRRSSFVRRLLSDDAPGLDALRVRP